MKVLLLVLTILVINFAKDGRPAPLISSFDQALEMIKNIGSNIFDEIQTYEEKSKSLKCIMQNIEQVKDMVKIGQNIHKGEHKENFGIVGDQIKRFFQTFDSCSTLFCYQPTFKKCEAENPQGCEKTGLIVYPRCEEGYKHLGSNICIKECEEGFKDDGLFCRKPKPYGRGVGYVLWKKDKCELEHEQGCEKNGALYYPKCKEGYHNVACCICSPNCPEGWTDTGIGCAKPQYGRGVGYAASFGLKCLVSNLMEDFTQILNPQESELYKKCNGLSEDIRKKSLEVEGHMGEMKEEQYQEGFITASRQLGEMINLYNDQCSEIAENGLQRFDMPPGGWTQQ